MYPSQDNINNDAHESYFTGFLNETTAKTISTQAENINCNDPTCNCSNDTSVMNSPAAHATISLDHNQPRISHNTSNNNDIISPGNTNYQQPICNDVSNNNINISPNNKYQQSMFNNTSSPPQFHPQYIDQNPLQTNVFPSLNSLGIVINSPQTYVVIMPVPVTSDPNSSQQDSYPNHSIRH
uniref:Uncharacterized protein n=1 Tax=Rhizophagus irregularis (strain DAOM 181602 / DAOM 197198 / MUCL 43194) TaxID=747089 RepID=U9T365_RHIID